MRAAGCRVRLVLCFLVAGSLSLVLPASSWAGKGVVSVFGSSGSGDGQFANAYGTAVNLGTGDVYVVDQVNHRVEQFDAGGVFVRAFGWGVADGSTAAQTCTSSCQAGVPGSGDGQFDTPQGIAIDQSDDSVYVVDGANNRVEKFDASGVYQSQFGTSGSGDGQFSGPQGIAVDPTDGSVYVADTGDHRIEKFDNGGVYQSQFGSEGSGDGQFEGPTRVAVDSTGQIYVLDSGNGRIQRFTSASAFDQVIDPGDVFVPVEIAVGPGNDHLYVAQWAQDFSEQRVIEIDGTGALVDTHGVGSTASNSSGLALSADAQKIYLADGFNARVFILDDVNAPSVAIDPASNVTSTSASLSGTVTPNAGSDVSWHFEISTDDASWTPTADEQDAGSGNAPVPVSQDLSGLVPNTTYFVRLVAKRPLNAPAISPEIQFTTTALKPAVVTEPAQDIGTDHATLEATLNAHHSPTTYFFEYGTTTSYGQRTPATDADGGSEEKIVGLFRRVGSLSVGTTYHYRIVATNQVGTSHGDDQVLTTTTPPPASSPRAGIPGTGFLSDNRGWELVSPADKLGNDVLIDSGRTRAAVGGNAVGFASLGGFADVRGGGVAVDYMSIRHGQPGTSGWATHAITPVQGSPGFQYLGEGFRSHYEGELSPDLSRGVLRTASPITHDPNVEHVGNLYVRDDLRTPGTGSYQLATACPACGSTPLTPLSSTLATAFLPLFAGASADFGHVLFESAFRLTSDSTADGSPAGVNLYEWDHGVVRLAGILPDGTPAPESQAGPGVLQLIYPPRTISADGSRIFFTDNPGTVDPVAGTLYMRVNHASTVQINASERTEPDPNGPAAARYWNASVDGSRAFFTSTEALSDDAGPGTNLYMYDVAKPAGHHLSSLVPGAEVSAVIGVSNDGHYVYFVASGQPVAGQPTPPALGFFAWHDGRVSYIGELTDFGDTTLNEPSLYGSEPRLAARVTPDGRHLLFTSSTSQGLTDYDQSHCGSGCEELYLYNADTQSLRCVSCNPTGAPATANAVDNREVSTSAAGTTWHLNRAVADDGRRVFFTTIEALVPEDSNHKEDVYEYDTASATVHLISSGRDPSGSYFMDASASGNDVFFVTRQQLVGWDHDQNYDLYDARVGGGVPEPAAAAAPCSSDGCQGASGPPPSLSTPGSLLASGSGNLKPATKHKLKRLVCKRGTVRKKVRRRTRCVKRKRRRAHKTAIQAGRRGK
jgi:DNA-binding beta-propeller fold protein YncE